MAKVFRLSTGTALPYSLCLERFVAHVTSYHVRLLHTECSLNSYFGLVAGEGMKTEQRFQSRQHLAILCGVETFKQTNSMV
jgi:hypothetical protein